MVKGVVKFCDIGDRTFRGGARLHSVKLDDDIKYSMFSPSTTKMADPGDTVEFEAVKNDKGYWNIKDGTFRVVERGSVPVAAPGHPDRQGAIMRQSCMGYAATIVSAFASGLTTDEAAQEVVRIAEEYLFPYAENGKFVDSNSNPVSDIPPEDDGMPF